MDPYNVSILPEGGGGAGEMPWVGLGQGRWRSGGGIGR